MKNSTPFMWRKGITLSATFLLALFLIVSCKKKNKTIGQSSINQSEILGANQADTFDILTYTVYDDMDSLATSSAIYGVLGSSVDPVFGKMNAEIYTQIKLQAFGPDFGDLSTVTIDSVVLGLQYAGYYGNEGIQTIEVYELQDTMSTNSTYYASSTKSDYSPFGESRNLVELNDNPFGASVHPRGEIDFDVDDQTIVGGDTLPVSVARVRLNKDFAWNIIEESQLNPSTFQSNDAFSEFMKGLHIKTNNGYQSSGEGGVFYFDLEDTYSRVTIYWKQGGVQMTPYYLLINSQTAKFTHVDIDHSGTNIENVVNDTTLGLDQFYAQAFGSRAMVVIPGLENIPSNAIIHKATLEIPVEYQTGSNYAPADDIAVTLLLEEGGYGFYDFVGYNNFNKSYTIDLRAYAQAVVNKQIDNTGLALSPVLYITSGDRIIFNGSNSSNKGKPRLNIVYTEF